MSHRRRRPQGEPLHRRNTPIRSTTPWSCTKLHDDSTTFGSACSDDAFVPISTTSSASSTETYNDPYLVQRRKKRSERSFVEVEGYGKENLLNESNDEFSRSAENDHYGDCKISLSGISLVEVAAKHVNPQHEHDVVSEISPKRRMIVNAQLERTYWKNVVRRRAKECGENNLQTAEAIMNLANAHVKCKAYPEALVVYKSALQIFRRVYGHFHLAVAKCLDKVGLSGGRGARQHDLQFALKAIHEAFLIRYQLLGPHHIDTVDSLNNLAGLYMRMGFYKESREAYYQVWVVRQAIFGQYHPSVAVTAHALGGVHVRLSEVDEACAYYNQARNIYLRMKLDEKHPDVKRLLRDIASAERVMVSTNMCYRY